MSHLFSKMPRFLGFSIIFALLGAGTLSPAWANTITVTNDADSGSGSLRQAISDAASGDTIDFDSDYTITLGSELAIGKDLTITGTGAGLTIIQASATPDTASWRVFNITGGTVTLEDMTIRHGNVASDGGGIYNNAGLNIIRCVIENNKGNWGGGIFNYNNGNLSIRESTISGNSAATHHGGGIYDRSNSGINIQLSTIHDNRADFDGGGVCLGGGNTNSVIENTSIANNITGSSFCGGGLTLQDSKASLRNTIIANNSGGSDYQFNDMMGMGGLVDNGYNVVENSNTGAAAWAGGFNSATSILYNTKYGEGGTGFSSWTQGGVELGNQNLNLATGLADNGGPTPTLALASDSFAAASPTTGIPPANSWNNSPRIDGAYTDQRGILRMNNQNTSIGAYSANYIPAFYFRSKDGGNWSETATWQQSSDGSTWEDATATPDETSLGATIRNTHTVTVSADVTTDQTTVASGGTLAVAGGQTLTVADGEGVDLTVSGTLTISTGTVDVNGGFDATDGVVTFTDAGALNLGGAVTSLGTLTPGTGTVTYDAGGAQTVIGANYNNLAFGGSGTKTLAGAVDANGNLSIGGGVTLDASGSNHGINAAGNWSNGGTFNGRSGTVTFDGASTQSISGDTSFYNLTISNTHALEKVSAAGSTLAVANWLNITDGIFVSASDYHDVTIGANTTLELSGDITVSGAWANSGTLTPGTHTVALDGTNQSVSGDNSFYNLTKTVSSAAALTFAAGGTTTITNTMNFQGASGELLSLRSSSEGARWNINPANPPTIAYLNVKDSNNTSGTEIDASSKNCVTSGNNVNWIFDNTAPTVTTQAVDNIADKTATGHGAITNNGYPNPTQHGVCWSTETSPDINDDCTTEGAVAGTGTFSTDIAGLNPDTTYYVRAYAANTVTTAYGNEVSFTTEVELPTHVQLTGPATILKDGLGAFTLTALDSVNQASNVNQNTVFSLTSNPSGAAFYSDSAGTTAITSATIPDGSSSVTFYCRDDTFGTPTLTATRTGGMALGSGTLPVRISGNNALSLDGTDDYVDCGTINLSGSALTLEAWVRPVAFQSVFPNISSVMGEEDGNDTALFRFGDAGLDKEKPQFVLYAGGETKLNGNTKLSTNNWHHLAATYDGSHMKIYINGKEDASKAQTGDITANSSFRIGAVSSGRYLNGHMDEIRVWNVARSADEIRANMHRELQGNETGLVSYYKLDTGTGTTAHDSGVGENDGTLTGAPAWQTSGAVRGPGNALDFDPSDPDEYVLGSRRIMTNTDNWTIMAWVRLDRIVANQYQFVTYNGDDSGGYGFCFNNGELLGLYGAVSWHNTGVTVSAGTWNHVAMRRENGTLRFFLNGKLLSYSYTLQAPKSPYDLFTVGNMIGSDHTSPYAETLDGQVDELSFWDKALSAQEIRDNLCQSLQGDEPGLAAYFRMDQQAAAGETTLYDQTPNGNDGTLTNMDPETDWVQSTAFNAWIGSSGTGWATATNWSRGSTPAVSSPYDNVGIPDFSNATGYPAGNAPAISGTPVVNHLVLESSSSMTLSSNLTVNGNLILENNLDLNGQIITLGTEGYLMEDGGLAGGSSGVITTTRDINNPSSLNVAGLGAEITASGKDLGSTTVTRGVAAQTGAGHTGIKRYYHIDPTNNSGLNATLVFHYDESELNGITENRLLLYKSTDSGSTWTEITAALNTTENTLTATGLDGFSRWTAGDSDNPLLVDLVSFSATGALNAVTLTWLTASEMDAAGFHLWRRDGSSGDYIKITSALIPAEGNATCGAAYTYNDMAVTPTKVYYYKLEDVSTSGSRSLHGPVSAVVGDAKAKTVTGSGTIGEADTAAGLGDITLEGTGSHTVTTGKYAAQPSGTSALSGASDWWVVDVTNPTGLTTLTFRFCPAASTDVVYYRDGNNWQPCSRQAYENNSLRITVTESTQPKISDMGQLVFALTKGNSRIPTLTQWGLIIFVMLLAAAGGLFIRRNGDNFA